MSKKFMALNFPNLLKDMNEKSSQNSTNSKQQDEMKETYTKPLNQTMKIHRQGDTF